MLRAKCQEKDKIEERLKCFAFFEGAWHTVLLNDKRASVGIFNRRDAKYAEKSD